MEAETETETTEQGWGEGSNLDKVSVQQIQIEQQTFLYGLQTGFASALNMERSKTQYYKIKDFIIAHMQSQISNEKNK